MIREQVARGVGAEAELGEDDDGRVRLMILRGGCGIRTHGPCCQGLWFSRPAR
jgi:hypothetical protein